jgi:indole-3-glycerol phosphate synthase
MSILEEIFAHKQTEVAAAKIRVSISDLERQIRDQPRPPDFVAAVRQFESLTPRLIAEVKYRSPSKGILCPDFDPEGLAQAYAANGAAAISVLTDEKYFGGSLAILRQIADLNLGLPLLRKDFIFDPYQIYAARAAGASAILLIVAMLAADQLQELLNVAHSLDMGVLVETHTQAEVDQAIATGAQIIGVNNRNLHTFTVSLETSLALRAVIPPDIVMVAESGIHTPADVDRLAAAGVDAMLIGEGLVTADDVGVKVREMVRGGGVRVAGA